MSCNFFKEDFLDKSFPNPVYFSDDGKCSTEGCPYKDIGKHPFKPLTTSTSAGNVLTSNIKDFYYLLFDFVSYNIPTLLHLPILYSVHIYYSSVDFTID